jgi:Leucine-rich repeat (LRR) protein
VSLPCGLAIKLTKATIAFCALHEVGSVYSPRASPFSQPPTCVWVSVVLARRLEALHLGQNNISGTIPPLTGLPALSRLNLGHNPGLSGSLSPGWSALTSILSLKLEACNISGTLPSEWGRAGIRLSRLDVSRNRITGKLRTRVRLALACIGPTVSSDSASVRLVLVLHNCIIIIIIIIIIFTLPAQASQWATRVGFSYSTCAPTTITCPGCSHPKFPRPGQGNVILKAF